MDNQYNVLIIFFNNINRFKKSFDAICKAKPKNLFLYQDGPRDNTDDLEGINKCREYAESHINWECNIHKLYQKKNYGCDPSNFIAQKWVFSIVDKCIILEDDDVCPPDFFYYCWELLNKYEYDNRICIICGMNVLDEYESGNTADYFFTSGGSIWGWASWRRVIDSFDENYTWLDDANKVNSMRPYFRTKKDFSNFINLARKRRASGIAYYETILGASQMLNHQLNIVPTKNLVSNIGNSDGVHVPRNLRMIPKKMRNLYNKKTFSINHPIIHPTFVFDDINYKNKINKILKLNIFESTIMKIKRLFFSNGRKIENKV